MHRHLTPLLLLALAMPAWSQSLPPGVAELADSFHRWSPAASVPLDPEVPAEMFDGATDVVRPGDYSLDGLPFGESPPPALPVAETGDPAPEKPPVPPLDGPGVASDWQTYTNARFGTTVDYPADRFRPLPPPQNGDGQAFESTDGSATFRVWGSHNVLDDTPGSRMGSTLGNGGFETVRNAALTGTGDGFTVEALRGGRLVLHRELFRNGIIHGFEAELPAHADPAPYRRMMDSLRAVNVSFDTPAPDAPKVTPQPETPGTTLPPPPTGGYYTPARGTAERSQIMDAARVVIVPELRQQVIFLVSTLRSNGQWAYLSAEPLQPDGQKLNWFTTPYARDWQNDAMSNLVMVLLAKGPNGWRPVDYVIGPTDVHWYAWLDRYGLPEALFYGG